MPIISVIMPVYNAEKSLDTCLQSIVEQSVGDLEIICVDDGSTDGSYEKLVGWRKKDGRIKVLRQENKGGGTARNLGLAKAAGEYIHFLDSDDSLQPQAYETMYEEICRTRADVCFCQYYNIDVSAEKKAPSDIFWRCPEIVNTGLVCVRDHENVFFYSAVVPWNKLYRRSFLKKRKLLFDEVKSANDRLFYFRLLAANPLVCFVNEPLVNYMVNHNPQSLSNLQDERAWDDHLRGFAQIVGLFEDTFLRRMATDVCFFDLYNLYLKNLSALTPAIRKKLGAFLTENAVRENDVFSAERRGFYRLLTNDRPMMPIVFSADDNYLPYLAVTLESMLANAAGDNFYDIFIFYDKLSAEHRELLAEQAAKHPNAAITFFNVGRYINGEILYSRAHYSKEMYYRLLIPDLLGHYEKALYLDCDLLIEGDVGELWKQDVRGFLLGAVRNYLSWTMTKYVTDILKLDAADYFNSGVLLLDLEACRRFGLKEKCLAKLGDFDKLVCPDQDLLNLCCRGKVMFLDMRWNVMWQHLLRPFAFRGNLSVRQAADYELARQNPLIIHYTTNYKPWNYPGNIWADKWWRCAVKTPFYPGIVYGYVCKNVDDKINEVVRMQSLPALKRRYWCLWIASKFVFGKSRKELKKKRKELKQQIKAVKKLSKEKLFKTGI